MNISAPKIVSAPTAAGANGDLKEKLPLILLGALVGAGTYTIARNLIKKKKANNTKSIKKNDDNEVT